MAATTTSNAESVDLSESNPAGTHSSAWIKRQPADHYTIQLVSTVEKETLNPFIRHHKLDDRVAYYRKNINGKTWHALIYGVYSSTAEARAAVSELPDELSNNKPWIQKIQTIQQAIDDFSNGS
jgi:DamX protein